MLRDGADASRVIEEATYTDVAARYICGNRAHPDHTVICRFRSGNRGLFKEIFTKVLVMAQEMGIVLLPKKYKEGEVSPFAPALRAPAIPLCGALAAPEGVRDTPPPGLYIN